MDIKHFSLVTNDYKDLRDFYRDLLNLNLDFDDEENEYCQFDLIGDLKIDFESQKVIDAELPDLGKKVKLLIRVEVESVDELYRKVRQKHKPLSKPTDRAWGMRNFYLLDPAENLVEFYQKIGSN